MLPYFHKIYWIKNFETGKVEDFSEHDDRASEDNLKQKNEEGFNIYQTVNTFLGTERKKKDLAEVKACFIDIDFPEAKGLQNNERALFLEQKMSEEIHPILEQMERKYDIYPSAINVTHKGFHILFEYDRECCFITPELHGKINNTLNMLLFGDKNARDLARVYKVVGYFDRKNGSDFLIRPIEGKPIGKDITKEIIENRFGISFEGRTEEKLLERYLEMEKEGAERKIAKKESGSATKWGNIAKINLIDSREFIEALSQYFGNPNLPNKIKAYSKEIIEEIQNKLRYKKIEKTGDEEWYRFLEADGKKTTGGLYLVYSKGKHTIDDYSKKTRRGNYQFLKNWILENVKLDFSELNHLVFATTGIPLGAGDGKKYPIDKKIFLDFLNSRLILPKQKEDVKSKTILQKYSYPVGFPKVFVGLLSYIYNYLTIADKLKKDTTGGSYVLEVNEFLKDTFSIEGKSRLEHNKKVFFQILEIIAGTQIETLDQTSGKPLNIQLFKKLEKAKRGTKDVILFEPINPKMNFSSSPAFFNRDILSHQKGFKESKLTDFFLFVNGFLNNSSGNINYEISDVFSFLGYQTENMKSKLKHLKDSLKDGQKNGFFKSFEIKINSVFFSKFEITKEKKSDKVAKRSSIQPF